MDATLSTMITIWEKAQRLQRIATYHQRAARDHRDGLYLSASRWTDLANYEHDQLQKQLNRQAQAGGLT